MPEPDAVHELVHDLRNRLSTILSAANAIQRTGDDQEFCREMVDVIRDNVDRANQSLGNLLQPHEDGPTT